MTRPTILSWACVVLFVVMTANVAQGIGVNWGSQCSHNLLPSIVVQLLKDNGINKVKLFDADSWVVKEFAGSGIEVMLGIPNNGLKRLSERESKAEDWVKQNVTKQLKKGVDIKYVAVGNEPFLTSYNGSYLKTTLPAMKNIQKALNNAGLGDKIRVTTPLNADVYNSTSDSPSDGDFRKDIKDTMVEMVQWLHSNKSPFLVNIYPFLSLYDNSDFPVDFAFFDGKAKSIEDKGNSYTNMFDANFDTLVWSLKKAGVPDLKIMVGEAGWPTNGNIYANNTMAKRFYDGFLKKLAANKGTPLRPGHIETYLFSLFDEDQKSIAPGNFERHWGLFRFDGQPKFPIDFTGQHDGEKMPVAAKGVKYLSKKWCVFNKDVRNMSSSGPSMDYACRNSDCTALEYGSSCNKLNHAGNVSYAFNMYYQTSDQHAEACAFGGLAMLTETDPSTDICLFPLQIESAAARLGAAVTASAAAVLLVLAALF